MLQPCSSPQTEEARPTAKNNRGTVGIEICNIDNQKKTTAFNFSTTE